VLGIARPDVYPAVLIVVLVASMALAGLLSERARRGRWSSKATLTTHTGSRRRAGLAARPPALARTAKAWLD
jgi:hypothetical protein